MPEWMVVMLNEDDTFGESLARTVKMLVLGAFVLGCGVGATTLHLLEGF